MYTFTKLHDRRIPKVRVGVGVGPMELQLIRVRVSAVECHCQLMPAELPALNEMGNKQLPKSCDVTYDQTTMKRTVSDSTTEQQSNPETIK